jgi:hypothetical protein
MKVYGSCGLQEIRLSDSSRGGVTRVTREDYCDQGMDAFKGRAGSDRVAGQSVVVPATAVFLNSVRSAHQLHRNRARKVRMSASAGAAASWGV